jgi:hypothetical protein
MRFGGNRKARDAFQKLGILDLPIKTKYVTAGARQYAAQLQNEASGSVPAPVPPPVIEEPPKQVRQFSRSKSDPSVNQAPPEPVERPVAKPREVSKPPVRGVVKAPSKGSRTGVVRLTDKSFDDMLDAEDEEPARPPPAPKPVEKYESYSYVPQSTSFVPESRPPPRAVSLDWDATARKVTSIASDVGGVIGVVALDVGQSLGSIATTAWEKGKEYGASLLHMMNWDGADS